MLHFVPEVEDYRILLLMNSVFSRPVTKVGLFSVAGGWFDRDAVEDAESVEVSVGVVWGMRGDGRLRFRPRPRLELGKRKETAHKRKLNQYWVA